MNMRRLSQLSIVAAGIGVIATPRVGAGTPPYDLSCSTLDGGGGFSSGGGFSLGGGVGQPDAGNRLTDGNFGLEGGFWSVPVAAIVEPPQDADLSITKEGSPEVVTSGEVLTYAITVSNNGPSRG